MKRLFIAMVLLISVPWGVTSIVQAGDAEPTSIQTRIGTLEFTHDFANGYPTNETVTKLNDELDFQRACQAYLWALPIVSFAEWQRAYEIDLGASNGEMVSYTSYDDKLGILTANATTPYLLGFANLEETGPLVVDMPENGIYGGFLDFWQRPLFNKQSHPIDDRIHKYLLVGPGQDLPLAEGFHVLQSSTNNVLFGFRLLITDREEAKSAVDQLKIYPYGQLENQAPVKIIAPEGKKWSGVPPRGLAYWERLSDIINQEPVAERDRFFMAMLKPLGIEKGKPFTPDERQKNILIEAVLVGEAMAKANTFEKRFEKPYWPDGVWKLAMAMNPDQKAPNYEQLDERAAWFYEAVTSDEDMATKTPGVGSTYLAAYKDKDGVWLDGGDQYILHVPPNPPMKQFWSVTLYDVDTRCLIVNEKKIADRSSRLDLIKNKDGSVDIHMGPEAPLGFEKNWIPTVPGKAWFVYFRLYAPTEGYFDKTWTLSDIEKLK